MQSADSVVNRQQGELKRKILILPEERKKAEGGKTKKNLATTYSPTDEAAVPSAKRVKPHGLLVLVS